MLPDQQQDTPEKPTSTVPDLNSFLKEIKGLITKNEVEKALILLKKQSSNISIPANKINGFGVTTEALKDKKQSKFAIDFYKLAADKGNNWGNDNYARCLLDSNKQLDEALKCAKRAVELVKDSDDPYEHTFSYWRALIANKMIKDAEKVLLDCLEVYLKEFNDAQSCEEDSSNENQSSNGNELSESSEESDEPESSNEAESANNIQLPNDNVIEFFKDIIDNIDSIKKINLNVYNKYSESLEILSSYSKKFNLYDEHQRIQNIILKHYKAIMSSSFYTENQDYKYKARAEIINKQILASLDSVTEQSDQENTNPTHQLFKIPLPNDINLNVEFDKAIVKQANWLKSFSTTRIEEEFKKASNTINKLKEGKENEGLIFNRLIDKQPTVEQAKHKDEINEDLKKIKAAESRLGAIHADYSYNQQMTARRHKAECRFFNPKRIKKNSNLNTFTANLVDNRYKRINKVKVDLQGKSARLFITAEKAFQKAIIALTRKDAPYLGIPIDREKKGEVEYGFIEEYQTGTTTISCRQKVNPDEQRVGDCVVEYLSNYDKICKFLNKLAQNNSNKKFELVGYMIRYAKYHTPISYKELESIYPKLKPKHVHHFNVICFLIMEKEQAQWQSATHKRFQLGMSVAQARSLILLKHNYLTFDEVFKLDSEYGIYSQTKLLENPDKLARICERIDKLYLTYLLATKQTDYRNFVKKFIDTPTPPKCLLTMEQAHQDLKTVYGNGYETDGAEYDSDISMEP